MKKATMIKNIFLISTAALALSSCSTFFDKDNTPAPAPLVNFQTEASVKPVWSSRVSNGTGNNYVRLAPTIANGTIYTVSAYGVITANDAATGKSTWKTNIGAEITGGAAATDGRIYAGTREGELYSLNQADGKMLWQADASSEILAPAAANHSIVLAKAIDGSVTAFSTENGHQLWKHQQTEPNLILRGSSAPQLLGDSAIVGFENGDLLKLSLRNGRVQWQKTIAEPKGIFAIQRMVDIDADPIVAGSRVYVATYQGRIAALNTASGEEIWNHDISSYSGMTTDSSKVYITDAQGNLWAFNASNGNVSWEQTKLYARTLTGPASIGNYIVVGDAEGYLHWISKVDGHFVARTLVNKSGIIAAPIVYNNTVYVYTRDGHLAAYTVR